MRLIQSTALRHLAVTQGGRNASEVPLTDQPSLSMGHVLMNNPKLGWLAIEGGLLIGFSVGFVRDELWFLSDLFVLPEAHNKGVGRELMRRCLDGGVERGTRIRAVVSSGDPGAQALYIRAGMVPRFSIFGLIGPVRGLKELAPATGTIRQAAPSRTWIGRLGDLDEMVWGRRRDADHRFWLGAFNMTCLTIADASGGLLGYAYYEASEYEPRRVGPIAARTARLQLLLLRAIGDAMSEEGAGTLEMRVPGINMTVMSALLKLGFRIDHLLQFMSSRAFGQFDRYVPSGGTLL